MRRGLAHRISAPLAVAIIMLAAAPAAAATPVTFTPYEVVFLDESAVSVAIADVTGDGRQDVLLTTMYSGYHPETAFKLFLFPQLPDGSLGAPTRYPTDGQLNGPMGLATGDLDGDGIDDVAVATDAGIDVFIHRGNGLQRAKLVPTSHALGVAIADVDLDGKQDIVTNTVDGVILLTPTKRGYASSVVTPEPQTEVEVGDLTGDGLPDIAGCSGLNVCTPTVNVFEQDPNSTFSVRHYPTNAAAGWYSGGIGVGDVTGDGRDDVTMSLGGSGPDALVYVFPQTVEGLATPTAYGSFDSPQPVAVADMNGDGLGDVVTLHGYWGGVYLQEAGVLSPESLFSILYSSLYNPQGLAIGDINNDMKPDVAVAGGGGLAVIRQE
jgi:hypothetical protein